MKDVDNANCLMKVMTAIVFTVAAIGSGVLLGGCTLHAGGGVDWSIHQYNKEYHHGHGDYKHDSHHEFRHSGHDSNYHGSYYHTDEGLTDGDVPSTVEQDLRDPEFRATLEQLLKDIAKLNQEDPPYESPPSVFDPVPNTIPGMSEEQCEEEIDPELKQKVQGRTPVMADLNKGVEAYTNMQQGVPDWYDMLTILECEIERPTPKEDVLGWGVTKDDMGVDVYVIFYDSNKDDKLDATLEIWDFESMPTFYMFDRTYNGSPNIVYQDMARDGTCSNIQIVRTQKDKPKEFNPREEL